MLGSIKVCGVKRAKWICELKATRNTICSGTEKITFGILSLVTIKIDQNGMTTQYRNLLIASLIRVKMKTFIRISKHSQPQIMEF